jgi:uncharacterized membrane protein
MPTDSRAQPDPQQPQRSVPHPDIDEYDWRADDLDAEDEEEQAEEPIFEVDDRQLIQALGWFSIALGAVELFAPRAVNRAIGVGDHPVVTRLVGIREVVTGIGLLSERAPGWWAWARAAGDAMDLGLLGAAGSSPDADPKRIAIAATSVLAVGGVDVLSGQRLLESQSPDAPEVEVCESLAINASPQQLYSFWRNAENLPRFMQHLESVTTTGERTSHWIARAPGGGCVEWDSEIVDDQPGQRIGWCTLPSSQITHEGMVTFEPAIAGRGSIVRVEMLYRPPAGKLGKHIARLFGEEPGQQIRDDLRRLKQLLEAGEVATTQGQPSGRRSLIGRATLGRIMQ